MDKKQIRNSVVTIFYEGNAYEALPDWSKFGYMERAKGQLEACPTSKKLHWQCFLEFKHPKRLMDLRADMPGVHFKILTIKEIEAIAGKGKKSLHKIAGQRYVHKDHTCVDKKFRFDWPTNPGNGAFYLKRRVLSEEASKIARTIDWDPGSDIRNQKDKFINLLKAQISVAVHELKCSTQ